PKLHLEIRQASLNKENPMTSRTVIAGATGLIWSNLADHLISKGWEVHGIARKPESSIPGVRPVAADLLEPEALRVTGQCSAPEVASSLGAAMPTKRRDESLIRYFAPYDPFEAGRVMGKSEKNRVRTQVRPHSLNHNCLFLSYHLLLAEELAVSIGRKHGNQKLSPTTLQ
ncbi:MAG TPA: NAD-dependent epimerase/dehydratase family protein, partial [Gemmataceae bacterium]|nr:NAD-dependent epimerase/dehydratase family protein [Gemmataceae bacterium]